MIKKITNLVICSFYTSEDYYVKSAEKMRARLNEIGVTYCIKRIEKPINLDWADICRKKIPFMNEICSDYPHAKVLWIDIDSEILYLPKFIRYSTADLIGFQRGDDLPINIGYSNYERFWQPGFFGIGTSKRARDFIAYAAHIENQREFKATDDYFLEEAWQEKMGALNFQIIPSCMTNKKNKFGDDPVFYIRGDSGNVPNFIKKVKQHEMGVIKSIKDNFKRKIKKYLLLILKEKNTHIVIDFIKSVNSRLRIIFQSKNKRINLSQFNEIKNAFIRKDFKQFENKKKVFLNFHKFNRVQRKIIDNIESQKSYLVPIEENNKEPIRLGWWNDPGMGNFGDWLSPYIIKKKTNFKVELYNLLKSPRQKHLIGIGSIGKFTNPYSIVFGTGISNLKTTLNKQSDYVSLRGPLTAKALLKSGGPRIDNYGDPGLLLSKYLPIKIPSKTNNKVALVRHYIHHELPIIKDTCVDEYNILTGSPKKIEGLINCLKNYDYVVTSAMHIMIICHTYGIPVKLIKFDWPRVKGDGIKYIDYCEGAEVEVVEPQDSSIDIRKLIDEKNVRKIKVKDVVIDRINTALNIAIKKYTNQ